jgi:hypothetical protein
MDDPVDELEPDGSRRTLIATAEQDDAHPSILSHRMLVEEIRNSTSRRARLRMSP